MQPITFSQEIFILIVDDDQELAVLLRDILHNEQRSVSFATDGKQAIELLHKHPCSILITDIQMPGTDGLSLMAQAQAIHPDILTIIMTGYASIETALKAVKEGAYDFLRKPFRLEEIKIRVENACERILCRKKNAALGQLLLDMEAELKHLQAQHSPSKISEEPVVIAPGWLPPELLQKSLISPVKKTILEIERLAELKEKGLLTDEEFADLKSKALTSR